MTDNPNATETMAERAWRYGLDTQPCRMFFPGWLFNVHLFFDNSAILFDPISGSPVMVMYDLALLPLLRLTHDRG